MRTYVSSVPTELTSGICELCGKEHDTLYIVLDTKDIWGKLPLTTDSTESMIEAGEGQLLCTDCVFESLFG